MRDYRNDFIQELKLTLADAGNLNLDSVISAASIILDKYELSERSTEIVPVDDANTLLIKTYTSHMIVNGRSEGTIRAYIREVKRLCEFLGNRDIKTICAFDIKNYLAQEKMRGVSNRTLENTRAYISAFCEWMTVEEYISKNPCMAVKPIKYTEEVRLPFTQVELDRIRSACKNQRERAIVEFLLASGVRISEFCALRVEDIDFNYKSVRIRHGKGDKERYTYINDLAHDHLVKYLTEEGITSGPLFISKLRKEYTPHGVRGLLNSIAARAKVEDVHPHRFRRTFATMLAGRGMDIQEIQKLMGHTNINTTMIYVTLDTANMKHSYEKYA